MPGFESWQRELRRRRNRFTPSELAAALDVPLKTVESWMSHGWLTFSVGKRGFALIRAGAVKRMLATHPNVAAVLAKRAARSKQPPVAAKPEPDREE